MSCLKAYTFKNNWHAFACPLGCFISSWFTVSPSLCSLAINSLGQPPKERNWNQQSFSEIQSNEQLVPSAVLGRILPFLSVPEVPTWRSWIPPWTGFQHRGQHSTSSLKWFFPPLGSYPVCKIADTDLQDKTTRFFSSLAVLLLALLKHFVPCSLCVWTVHST